MKKFLTILIIFLMSGICSFASNRYVSNSGNDSNSGLDSNNAWATLAKVNGFTYSAGDTILFQRNSIWYGAITVNRNDLVFDMYGTGAPATLTGKTNITSLTNLSGNIWYTTLPSCKYTFAMIALDGKILRPARNPNFNTTPQAGWQLCTKFTDTAITNKRDSTYIVGVPNGTLAVGDTFILRSWIYRNEVLVVNSVSVDTIRYRRSWSFLSGGSNFLEFSPIANRGIIRINKFTDLDTTGEYLFDFISKRLYVYLPGGLSGHTLDVATIDSGFIIGSRQRIKVNGIKVKYFNAYGFYGDGANNTVFKNTSADSIGGIGLNAVAGQGTVIDGASINVALKTGIYAKNSFSGGKDSVTITNCDVRNIARIVGQEVCFQDDGSAISTSTNNNLNITYNTINNVAKAGINFLLKNNGLVAYNTIDSSIIDYGDIAPCYIFQRQVDSATTRTYTNRVIRNNTIRFAPGSIAGGYSLAYDAAKIYLDGIAFCIDVFNNTLGSVEDTTGYGSYVQLNQPYNSKVDSNILYGFINMGIIVNKGYPMAATVEIKGNIFYTFNSTYTGDANRLMLRYIDQYLNGYTPQQSVMRTIRSDSNWFNKTSLSNFQITTGLGSNQISTNRTLFEWSVYSGNDTHSIGLMNYNRDSAIAFENPTDKVVNKSISFPATNPLVPNSTYNGGFTMQPYTSLLLLPKNSYNCNCIITNKKPIQKN